MRYLGIDYGTKKVGLAVSDEAGTMGFPRTVVPTTEAQARVLELIKSEGIGAIVMGESLDFAGRENPVAAEARAFAERLSAETGLPIAFEPEALTSAEARRTQMREPKSRKPVSREAVDASAAALILTSYLSRPRPTL